MWIGQIRLGVRTGNHRNAGTDHRVKVGVIRDGKSLVNLLLDYPTEDDLERGTFREYGFIFLAAVLRSY